jgi:transformation/transcription domain-associated protein
MKDPKPEDPITGQVYRNVDNFLRRVRSMSFVGDAPSKVRCVPVSVLNTEEKEQRLMAQLGNGQTHFVQSVAHLISTATAPTQLAQMNEYFMAWY